MSHANCRIKLFHHLKIEQVNRIKLKLRDKKTLQNFA